MVLHWVSRSALFVLVVVMVFLTTRTTGPLPILGVTALMVLALVTMSLTNPKRRAHQ